MATLGAPKAISPFIKFCRYSALGLGIGYGAMRYRYLKKKERKIQDCDAYLVEQRAAQLAEEKSCAERAEMEMLAKECGIPLPCPPEWTDPCDDKYY